MCTVLLLLDERFVAIRLLLLFLLRLCAGSFCMILRLSGVIMQGVLIKKWLELLLLWLLMMFDTSNEGSR